MPHRGKGAWQARYINKELEKGNPTSRYILTIWKFRDMPTAAAADGEHFGEHWRAASSQLGARQGALQPGSRNFEIVRKLAIGPFLLAGGGSGGRRLQLRGSPESDRFGQSSAQEKSRALFRSQKTIRINPEPLHQGTES